MATLLVSQGVPMILGGDEMLRTQRGNNNAWCQDNEISWVDWSLLEEHADFHRFVRQMIALRKRHHVLRRRTFFSQATREPNSRHRLARHFNPAGRTFSEQSHVLAFALDGRRSDRPEVDRDIYVAMNAHWEPQSFRIPASPSGRAWRRAVDTSRPSPDDALGLDEGPVVPVSQSDDRIEARTMIMLVSEA